MEAHVQHGRIRQLGVRDRGRVPEPPAGHYIVEFTDNKEHIDKDGNYRKHYPGFLKKPGKNGVCIPCCFSKRNKAFLDRKEQSQQDLNKVKDTIKQPSTLLRRASSEANEIILGPEKFPLEVSRWGYLPFSIQYFLDTDNTLCQKNKKVALFYSSNNLSYLSFFEFYR